MSWQITVKSAMNKLWFMAFPPVCQICNLRAQQHMDICAGCQSDLPLMGQACRRCAEPLAMTEGLCGRCHQKLPAFDQVHAGFLYEPPLSPLITHFKYQRQMNAGQALGQLLAGSLLRGLQSSSLQLPDCLVPVPLHPWRQIRRGFNQSAILAADISRYLQTHQYISTVNYQLLQRIQTTRPQTGLSEAQRRRNLRGAFKLTQSPPPKVALIDDVLTTGSTANECAQLLKQQGCEHVQVWVVARAERPK